PPVWRRAVLWKEIYCEAKPRQRWLRLFFGRWFFWVSFVPLFLLVQLMMEQRYQSVMQWTFNLIRYGGTLVVFGMLIRVAVHAARSRRRGKDRGTFHPLLTTDFTPRESLRDKWWGSFLASRWVLIWLTSLWCLSVMSLAIHPVAVGLLFVECLALAAFATSLGIYFSVRPVSSRQAAMTTLIFLLLFTTVVP